MELILIPLTSDDSYNFFFSIYANLSFYLVPIFGAMSLLRK
jgi:hypothetical protein